MNPLVTIAIPSYNHSLYIGECIKSIIDQDYENIELIIIDDGSKDDSVNEILNFSQLCENRFVRYEFRSRENKGLTETLNEALAWGRGEYFSAIASDDILLPKKTETLVKSIEGERDVAAVFGLCQHIDSNGFYLTERSSNVPEDLVYYDFNKVFFRDYNICTPAQLLRMDALKKIGGYPSGVYIEDYWAWLALTFNGYKLKKISEPVVKYRIHHANSHSNLEKMEASLSNILADYSQVSGYDKARAIFFLRSSIEWASRKNLIYISRIVDGVRSCPKLFFSAYFFKSFIRANLNFISSLLVTKK